MKKLIFVIITIIPLLTSCNKDNLLSVHIIDVGQGDSILIQTPDNNNILVDGGHEDSGLIIKKFLKHQKVKNIDFIIATHPDTDHIGSLDYIIDKFDVSHVYMPNKSTDSDAYYNLIESCSNKNLNPQFLSKGDTINLDNNIKITVLNPYYTHYDNNSNSIVFKLEYKNKSFLFTGDTTEAVENELIQEYNLEDIDFLKVAHHGSKNSTSSNFLKEVNPDVAAISCGYNNQYNHPHKETINRLIEENISIYRTDKQRHLSFFSNGDIIYTNLKLK
ncbi:MAG: ComEC/Rec2 family competence protein [Paraclostridium sp.]